MGYDMYLIKADKKKLSKQEHPLWQELNDATIKEVNSFLPILEEFYQQRDELHWIYEEYNIVSERTLIEIIDWLKNKISTEDFNSDIWEEKLMKMVYDNIKDWIPLQENEVVYFEEDS